MSTSSFMNFSEAGVLFSTNRDLIEEMRKAYEADALACVSAIEEGLRSALLGRELGGTQKGKEKYWWLIPEAGQDVGPQLWTKPFDPSHLNHERLIVVCGMDNNDPRIISAIADLGPSLGGNTYDKPTKWWLFWVELPLNVEDPVSNAVAKLAPILPAVLHEYRKWT